MKKLFVLLAITIYVLQTVIAGSWVLENPDTGERRHIDATNSEFLKLISEGWKRVYQRSLHVDETLYFITKPSNEIYCRTGINNGEAVTKWFNMEDEFLYFDDKKCLHSDRQKAEPTFAIGSNDGKEYCRTKTTSKEIITVWKNACTNEFIREENENTCSNELRHPSLKCYKYTYVESLENIPVGTINPLLKPEEPYGGGGGGVCNDCFVTPPSEEDKPEQETPKKPVNNSWIWVLIIAIIVVISISYFHLRKK